MNYTFEQKMLPRSQTNDPVKGLENSLRLRPIISVTKVISLDVTQWLRIPSNRRKPSLAFGYNFIRIVDGGVMFLTGSVAVIFVSYLNSHKRESQRCKIRVSRASKNVPPYTCGFWWCKGIRSPAVRFSNPPNSY